MKTQVQMLNEGVRFFGFNYGLKPLMHKDFV